MSRTSNTRPPLLLRRTAMMTHPPASVPFGLATTTPMFFSPILIAAVSLRCCAQAASYTPVINAMAATSNKPGVTRHEAVVVVLALHPLYG